MDCCLQIIMSFQVGIFVSCIFHFTFYNGYKLISKSGAFYGIIKVKFLKFCRSFHEIKLRKANSGSFEVMMGYSFMPERSKPAQKVRSVRFL